MPCSPELCREVGNQQASRTTWTGCAGGCVIGNSLRELVAPLISTGFATFEDVRRGGDAPARPVTPLQVVADAVFS